MSHGIEIVDGVAKFAFSGEYPWHGLGKPVLADASPEEILDASGANFTVEKRPLYMESADTQLIKTEMTALVRADDEKILSYVPDDWNPVQNKEAFSVFKKYVEAGDMEMHTAGVLKEGRVCFALAKIKESFAVAHGKDQIDNYLLFTNFHIYGKPYTLDYTGIRVICNNSLIQALGKARNLARWTHRRTFDAKTAEIVIGLTSKEMQTYRQQAEFLTTKRYNNESMEEYFKRLFPSYSAKSENKNKPSRNAQKALAVVQTQPGHDLATGTWWQPYNAVTFMVDHMLGRTDESRLHEAWYGLNRDTKTRALKLALEYARAA